jgi:hypothetical protein
VAVGCKAAVDSGQAAVRTVQNTRLCIMHTVMCRHWIFTSQLTQHSAASRKQMDKAHPLTRRMMRSNRCVVSARAVARA